MSNDYEIKRKVLAWMEKQIDIKQAFISNRDLIIDGFESGSAIEVTNKKDIQITFPAMVSIVRYAGTEGVQIEPELFGCHLDHFGRPIKEVKHQFVYIDWIFYAIECIELEEG